MADDVSRVNSDEGSSFSLFEDIYFRLTAVDSSCMTRI